MGIVRALLLVVVLLLACRPQLVMEHEEPLRSVVAVWVDTSASMTLEDPYTMDEEMRSYSQKVSDKIKFVATVPSTEAGANAERRARINRYELATATLSDAKWLRDLTDTQDVMFFTGSSRAELLGVASRAGDVDARVAEIRGKKPTGEITDVPSVMRDILERVQGQRLSAMVLLTDGQTTERGSRPDRSAAMAAQADTRVFALSFGQKEEPFNLKILPPQLPKSTFSRDPVSARVHVTASGITQPVKARVSIFRKSPDGSIDASAPLATKEVALDPTKQAVDLDIPVRLKKTNSDRAETFDLVARVEPEGAGVPEERTLRDNERGGTVTVLDTQINVLYVEGYPRWEYRYLKSELIREPTVNLSTLLATADEAFTQDADPPAFDKTTSEEIFPGALAHFPDNAKDLAKYDVLLIGDVEPMYFSPTQQKLIVEWVKTGGGGVGFISGPSYNPETYRESALEVLLPVTPDEIDPRARILQSTDTLAYKVLPSTAGGGTNLYRFFDEPDENLVEMIKMPDMFWFKRVRGLKPGAIVLAMRYRTDADPLRQIMTQLASISVVKELLSKSDPKDLVPMLVMRQYGAGPVIFSAYCDTWRWRRYSGEPLFQSYWLQMCRLLCANKALGRSKRLELIAESATVEIGGEIKVTLNVKDPTLTAQVPAEVPVMLVDKEGRTVDTLTLIRSSANTERDGALERLEGSSTARQLGEFRLIVKPGALPVDAAALELHVEQPQREQEALTADVQTLETIASRTRGAVLRPYDSGNLMKQIPDRSMPILHSQSEELWNKPFALVLVLLLATTEWLIRKRAGLI